MNDFFQWGAGNRRTPKNEQEVMDTYGQQITEEITKPRDTSFDDEQARLEALNMLSGNRLTPTQSYLDRKARYESRKQPEPSQSLDEQQQQFLADTEMFLDQPEPVSQPVSQPPVTQPTQEQSEPSQDPTETAETKKKKKAVDDIITKRALSDPNLSDRQRQAIIDRYESQYGKFNVGALLAGFGTALQGKGASGTDDVFAGQRQRMQDELNAFDTNRNQAYEDEVRGRERETYENERDPNSDLSIAARDYMAQMGSPVPENVSYAQIQKMYPFVMDKLNLDLKRSEIERTTQKDAYEFQQQMLKRESGFGQALDEEGANFVKNLTTQSNSVLGNIRKYTDMMRKGGFSGAEKQRQQQMLAAELESLDPALMPPAAKEEWLKIIGDRYFEFNSTTANRVDELQDYIVGNAEAAIKNNLTDTAIERFNRPQALRQLGVTQIRMIDPRDGKAKYIVPEAYQDALKKGWREVK